MFLILDQNKPIGGFRYEPAEYIGIDYEIYLYIRSLEYTCKDT
jgi:hypothetical protein